MKQRLASLALLTLTACAHPLSSAEVDGLTTCHDTDLKQIRRSLLLSGYEVKSETETDLVTRWKQVSGYGDDRLLERITVVQLDPKTFRFKVRLKEQYLEPRGDSIVARDRYRRHVTVYNVSPPVAVTDDFDPAYDDEHRDVYLETQHEVCGH